VDGGFADVSIYKVKYHLALWGSLLDPLGPLGFSWTLSWGVWDHPGEVLGALLVVRVLSRASLGALLGLLVLSRASLKLCRSIAGLLLCRYTRLSCSCWGPWDLLGPPVLS